MLLGDVSSDFHISFGLGSWFAVYCIPEFLKLALLSSSDTISKQTLGFLWGIHPSQRLTFWSCTNETLSSACPILQCHFCTLCHLRVVTLGATSFCSRASSLLHSTAGCGLLLCGSRAAWPLTGTALSTLGWMWLKYLGCCIPFFFFFMNQCEDLYFLFSRGETAKKKALQSCFCHLDLLFYGWRRPLRSSSLIANPSPPCPLHHVPLCHTQPSSFLPQEMTPQEQEIIKQLDKCDFREIHKYFVDKNEARKALSKEEKQVRTFSYDTWN